MSSRYKSFPHRQCEFFPCHKGADPDRFSCLFCFCPLYPLPDCGGDFTPMADGNKDCSRCLWPHDPDSYDRVIRTLQKKVFKPFDKK